MKSKWTGMYPGPRAGSTLSVGHSTHGPTIRGSRDGSSATLPKKSHRDGLPLVPIPASIAFVFRPSGLSRTGEAPKHCPCKQRNAGGQGSSLAR